MTKQILIITFLAITANSLKAQNAIANLITLGDSLKFNVKAKKFEVSLNISSYFITSSGPQALLRVKKNEGKVFFTGRTDYWRFGLQSFNGKQRYSSNYYYYYDSYLYKDQSTNLYLGWERLYHKKRLSTYWGLDLVPFFNQSKVDKEAFLKEVQIVNSAGDAYIIRETREIGTALRPFAGAKYFINQNFSFSFETAFIGSIANRYQRKTLVDYDSIADELDEIQKSEFKGWEFRHEFIPLSRFGFEYHF